MMWNKFTVNRRTCLLGALLAPLMHPLAAIELFQQPYNELEVMGKINGTSFVKVPEKAGKVVEWMILHGWTVSSERNGMLLMELAPL